MFRTIDPLAEEFDLAAPGAGTPFGAFTAPKPQGKSRSRVLVTVLLELAGTLTCSITRGSSTISGRFEKGASLNAEDWYGWELPVALAEGDEVEFSTSSAGKILYFLAELAPEGADS